MLDLDHPQTPFVFEAAKIQGDLIAVVIKAEQAGRSSLTAEGIEEANHQIELLETINFVGFGDDPQIASTLNRVKQLFNSPSTSCEQLRQTVLQELIQPNHNFGTWAI